MQLGEIETALLMAGQLHGTAMRLNVAVLEKYLENPPADFRYASTCRVAIEFRRALDAITSS